jgi:hypothetical protein
MDCGTGELEKLAMEVVVLIEKVEVVPSDELRCLSRAGVMYEVEENTKQTPETKPSYPLPLHLLPHASRVCSFLPQLLTTWPLSCLASFTLGKGLSYLGLSIKLI